VTPGEVRAIVEDIAIALKDASARYAEEPGNDALHATAAILCFVMVGLYRAEARGNTELLAAAAVIFGGLAAADKAVAPTPPMRES
jgi:hypothetical protein